ADPGAYKCAGDAEQNRDDATTWIFPRHQQFCDRTNDKTDKQSPNNRMSAKVHSETEFYRVESRPASKLVWNETIDPLATRLWRVLPAQCRDRRPIRPWLQLDHLRRMNVLARAKFAE